MSTHPDATLDNFPRDMQWGQGANAPSPPRGPTYRNLVPTLSHFLHCCHDQCSYVNASTSKSHR
eukprot:4733403-Pleurochrysis_carterae.AAC.1